MFSSVPACVEKIVENFDHVSVLVQAEFCLQPLNDLVHALGVAFESAAKVLCHLSAEVGGLVEGVSEDQVCLDVLSCAGVSGEG